MSQLEATSIDGKRELARSYRALKSDLGRFRSSEPTKKRSRNFKIDFSLNENSSPDADPGKLEVRYRPGRLVVVAKNAAQLPDLAIEVVTKAFARLDRSKTTILVGDNPSDVSEISRL